MNRFLAQSVLGRLNKSAVIAAGDPSLGGAPGAGGAPMDPAMMGGAGGGMPPMDPAMMGGAPPAPPPAPAPAPAPAAGQQMVEPIKPKIDVNMELMQIKKMLARLCDQLGVQIPAADMAVDSTDLTNMAQAQSAQPAGGAPQMAGAPIQPIQPMFSSGGEGKQGHAFGQVSEKMASVLTRLRNRASVN